MTMITTLAGLDALPIGTPVTDTDGDTWTRQADGWIHRDPDGYVSSIRYLTGEVFAYAPFRMAAAEPSQPHMVRCCAQGCPNTAALQPGSSYLCPDHGDGGCSDNTITKGES